MANYLTKTQAIILKTIDLKENDKIATILTEKYGKITVVMKGVKKGNNKNKVFSLQFCMGEMFLYKGKNMYIFNEGIVINSFQGLLNNMDTLVYGCLFCELIDIAIEGTDSSKQVFQLLAKTLYLLETKSIEYLLLLNYFQVQLMKFTGHGFNFINCSNCGKQLKSPYLFSKVNYSFVCNSCKTNLNNLMKTSDNTFKALRYMDKYDIQNIVRFNFSDKLRVEINMLLESVLKNAFYRLPKSLAFLDLIKIKE